MTLANELKNVIRIEIESPEHPGGSPAQSKRVVIDTPNIIRNMLSTLQFRISDRRAVQGCKVPPGFRVLFVTNKCTYETDVAVSGHKHMVVKDESSKENIHYELPPRFEKIIQPYLRKSLEQSCKAD